MKQAEIITPWVGIGLDDDPNRPRLGDDHLITKWEDVTGQQSISLPLDINIYVILIECEDSVLTEIESDNTYRVLWSETIVDGVI